MSSNLTPEERQRIAEEQRLRNKENLKMAGKFFGTTALIIIGLMVLLLICAVIFFTGILGGFGG